MKHLTKEIINEVLIKDREITSFEKYNNNAVIIKWISKTDGTETFHVENLHEFAQKCKLWAFNHGYKSIYSGIDTCNSTPTYFTILPLILDRDGYEMSFLSTESEPDSVFRACTWIMKDLKDKQ